jgi:hypothetical protein
MGNMSPKDHETPGISGTRSRRKRRKIRRWVVSVFVRFCDFCGVPPFAAGSLRRLYGKCGRVSV